MPNHTIDDTHVHLGHETFFQRPDRVHGKLYVITSIFNAVRWRSRWRTLEDFQKMVFRGGGELYLSEAAFRERDFVFAEKGNPKHLQLVVKDELWLKENMLNLSLQMLPKDWEYVLFADADIGFFRPDWADEIRQQLQHYPVLQPWSEAHDLNDRHEIIKTFKSFAWCYHHQESSPDLNINKNYYYTIPKNIDNNTYYWHPGYCWAFRRDALDLLGGLIDWSILGNADRLMAHAIFQQPIPKTYNLGEHGNRWLDTWYKRASGLYQNCGYVDGAISHNWHGPKINRQYRSRAAILEINKFDTELDLYKDWQGVYQLTKNNSQLRDDIRVYFRSRNEDAVSE